MVKGEGEASVRRCSSGRDEEGERDGKGRGRERERESERQMTVNE